MVRDMLKESLDQGIINGRPQAVDDLPQLEGEDVETGQTRTPQTEGRSVEEQQEEIRAEPELINLRRESITPR